MRTSDQSKRVSERVNFDLEAERIYQALFRTPVPPLIRQRFVWPSEQLNLSAGECEVFSHYKAVRCGCDLEALEIATRLGQGSNLLSNKFRLMVFLAETLPENQRFFVNTNDSLIRGLSTLTWAVVRTGVKILHGFHLRWRLKGD